MSARKTLSLISPLMRILITLGLLLTAVTGQAIERVTYYHNDALGSPVAATDGNGTLLWRESYAPYGERLTREASGKDTVWYTGKPEEAAFGLNYFGARWYDPKIGRFMGVDPAGFSSGNIQSFNRYAYANNNPYAYVDPNGQASVAVVVPAVLLVGGAIYVASGPEQQAQMGKFVTWMGQNVKENVEWAGDIIRLLTGPYFDESNEGNSENNNTNPYAGPVDEPVIVVDQHGNSIPVGEGQKVTTSPNGDYQQVRDSDGRATGVRLDRGGHRNRTDPKARDPHAHVPGVTTSDGNQHLPVNH